jgi:hypothetical protein
MTAIKRSRFIGLIAGLSLAGSGFGGAIQAAASDLPPFGCSNASGGTPAAAASISFIRVARHPGYDRLVIGFATANQVPQFGLQRQPSPLFTRDASGQSIRLQGAAGLRIVLQNTDTADGVPADLEPGLPEIREVANTGSFERVVTYGVGLESTACTRSFQLSDPSRLVIDVETSQDSTPAGLALATSSQPSTPQDLAATGKAVALGQPSVLAGGVGLLLAVVGLVIGGWYRFVRR